MKQTLREKDIPDRLFLIQALQREGVPPYPPLPTKEDPLARAPKWLKNLLNKLFGGPTQGT